MGEGRWAMDAGRLAIGEVRWALVEGPWTRVGGSPAKGAGRELHFIGEELGNVEYNNLPEAEKARCRAFAEARRDMADGSNVEAVEEEFSEDKLDVLSVADLQRQRAENNLKTMGDEEMERKEEGKGYTSQLKPTMIAAKMRLWEC